MLSREVIGIGLSVLVLAWLWAVRWADRTWGDDE
jgi:hypothetical protein